MTHVPEFLTNLWPHMLYTAVAVTVWCLAILAIEKRRIVPPFDRFANFKCWLYLCILNLVFLLAVQSLFVGCENPSLWLTGVVSLLLLGLHSFYLLSKRYLILWRSHRFHTVAIFVSSLFILAASVLLVGHLRTHISEIGGSKHSSDTTAETGHSVAARTLDETPVGHMLTTTGTIFAFIVGTATLIALFYTILQLRAQHTRITTYKQYLRECSYVLHDFLKRLQKEIYLEQRHLSHTPDEDTENEKYDLVGDTSDNYDSGAWGMAKIKFRDNYKVRMVCFTPLNGNVSLGTDSPEVRSYRALLDRLCKNAKDGWIDLSVVCLDDQEGLTNQEKQEAFGNNLPSKEILLNAAKNGFDLAQLYLGFTDRRSFTTFGEELGQAYCQAQVYVNKIRETNGDVKRKRRDELPTFHFMLINHVAIVGNPLRLPPPRSSVPLGTEGNSMQSERRKKKKVEIIGFRTDEPHVVESLEETFEFYRNYSAENV